LVDSLVGYIAVLLVDGLVGYVDVLLVDGLDGYVAVLFAGCTYINILLGSFFTPIKTPPLSIWVS
jgi:hypothetical protein